MKHLFVKWLSALLIAALLLTPVAMMEDNPVEEAVATEALNGEEIPAEPDAEPDAQNDDEPACTEDDVEEQIVIGAIEDSVEESSDVEWDGENVDSDEVFEDEISLERDDIFLQAAGNQFGTGYGIILNDISDQALRNALWIYDNNPRDGELSLDEIQNVKTLDLSGTTFSDSTSMSWLGWVTELNLSGCPNITDLRRFGGKTDYPTSVEKLDVSNCTNLKVLCCNESNISELNVAGCTNLEELQCGFNTVLTTLDVSTCTNLKLLNTLESSVTTLSDLSKNTKLEKLQCSETGLAALNVGTLANLKWLECGGNKLTKLDISGCANLTQLRCWDNGLSELNLSNNKKLAVLWCQGNPNLKTLDISNCEVLCAAVDQNAPVEVDWDDDGKPDCVGYGPYVDEWGNEELRLLCDKGVTIITKKTDPVPAAPVPVPAPVINAIKKNSKATVTAVPGTVCQLNLGGASGKKFKSSKKKVATVDKSGNVTIKGAGKTVISFKVGKKTRKVKLTVKDPTIPIYVTLSMSGTNTVRKGESLTLTATLPEGTNSGIKWKSSNKKVATVKNGVVKFKKKGKVTITATAKRGKKKAKVKFKVTQ